MIERLTWIMRRAAIISELLVLLVVTSIILFIVLNPARLGELAACWFDTFMYNFLEHIDGNYQKGKS